MHVEIADGPLALDPLVAAVGGPGAGAVVTFVGYVRDFAGDGRPVDGLSYEGHRDLALAEMRSIASEAAERFGGARVAIAHRLGALGVGEAAVAIVAAAAHRAEAFDACRYAIDELKKRVAIYKHERYRDGDARWVPNA